MQRLISKIFDRGKVCVPREIRLKLSLEDGDLLLWEVINGDVKIFKGKIDKT